MGNIPRITFRRRREWCADRGNDDEGWMMTTVTSQGAI